jgi:hypothetical protein
VPPLNISHDDQAYPSAAFVVGFPLDARCPTAELLNGYDCCKRMCPLDGTYWSLASVTESSRTRPILSSLSLSYQSFPRCIKRFHDSQQRV